MGGRMHGKEVELLYDSEIGGARSVPTAGNVVVGSRTARKRLGARSQPNTGPRPQRGQNIARSWPRVRRV